MAINSIADALVGGSSTYARDDDPMLVRDATPFALKTIEGLLEASPRHTGLLQAAASGFAQYAYAFVESEADFIEETDLARATEQRARAVRLYLRARDYGMRGLEVVHPGFGSGLRSNAAEALRSLKREDVALLHWTAAPWAAAISLSKENADLTADLPLTERMMARALELDESYDNGSIHDFFIAYEGSRPASAGGSVDKAREHLDRALAISNRKRVGPLVTYAESVLIGQQDRKRFEEVLDEALALDADASPELRMANLVSQRRARWLLGRVDSLFVE